MSSMTYKDKKRKTDHHVIGMATVFCFQHSISKHKLTRYATNLGEMVPLAPLPTPMLVAMHFFGEESCACSRNN